MAPDPLAVPPMDSSKLQTLFGIRRILNMQPAELAAAAQQSSTPLPAQVADNIAKAAAMRQDANSIGANGLPGYFDPQARTGVGMAPGAYQFNMPGPRPSPAPSDISSILNARANPANADQQVARATSLPQSIDPATDLRGSLQNNMRDRFSALAATAQPTEADMAVAGRNPNLGLSPRAFIQRQQIAEDRPTARSDYKDAVSTIGNGKGAPGSNTKQAVKDANRNLFDVSPADAQMNTYQQRLANMAPRQKPKISADLAQRIAQRQQGAGGQTFGMIPLSEGPRHGLSPAQVLEHNRTMAAINAQTAQGEREMQLKADDIALRRELGAGELGLKKEAASPEAIAGRGAAEQDPQGTLLAAEIARGALTPRIMNMLEQHAGAAPGTPGAPFHQRQLWARVFSAMPGFNRGLFDKWYTDRFLSPGDGTVMAPSQATPQKQEDHPPVWDLYGF